MTHPQPTYPADHRNQAAIRVPKGGSSCSSCKFLGEGDTCKSEYYVKWNNGDNKLLAPADSFCSDWYTPKNLMLRGNHGQ